MFSNFSLSLYYNMKLKALVNHELSDLPSNCSKCIILVSEAYMKFNFSPKLIASCICKCTVD